MPQIAQEVLKVLDAATIDGALLTLNGNLDCKPYVETNKVLEAAGGKWIKKAKAHVFDGDAIDAIEPIILTGEYRVAKQDFGQFDTPEELAHLVASLAMVDVGTEVLEPNIGLGRIAVAAERLGGIVTGYEIDPARASKALSALPKANIKVADFLTEEPRARFDRVVMNPPFAKQADIKHVLHAFKFLLPGGRLVSIMSNSVMFRDKKLTTDFREFVAAHGGTMQALPEGSFKSSGTGVNTCVVTIDS